MGLKEVNSNLKDVHYRTPCFNSLSGVEGEEKRRGREEEDG